MRQEDLGANFYNQEMCIDGNCYQNVYEVTDSLLYMDKVVLSVKDPQPKTMVPVQCFEYWSFCYNPAGGCALETNREVTMTIYQELSITAEFGDCP